MPIGLNGVTMTRSAGTLAGPIGVHFLEAIEADTLCENLKHP